MRKLLNIVLFFLFCLVLTGCDTHRAEKRFIKQGELLQDSMPDSALVVLRKVKLPEMLNDFWLSRWCLAYCNAADRLYEKLPFPFQLYRAAKWANKYGNGYERARFGLFYGRSLAAANYNSIAAHVYIATFKQAILDKEYNQAGYICSYFANLYLKDNDYKNAGIKYADAAKYFRLANNMGSYCNALKDVGHMYAEVDSFQKALRLVERAKVIADSLRDPVRIPIMYNALANIYTLMGKDSMAEVYVHKGISLDSLDKATNYVLLAHIFRSQGNIEGAEAALKHAEHLRMLNPHTPLSIMEEKYLIAEQKGDYKDAFEKMKQYDAMLDSIRKVENRTNIMETEKRYDNTTLAAENAHLKSQTLVWMNIGTASAFLCILTLMIYHISIRRKKQQILEKENLYLRLSEDLRSKQNELESLRVSHSKLTDPLRKEIDDLHTKMFLSTPIYSKIKKLSKPVFGSSCILTEKDWRDIHSTIDKIYPDFFNNLTNASSDLTEREIDFCYLQFFNLKIKEESLLLDISTEGVKKLRARIRQHFGIVGENQDLHTFFLSLSSI